MKKICKHCGKLIEYETPQQIGGHITACPFNPQRLKNTGKKKLFILICKKCSKEYKLELTEKGYNNGNYKKNCSQICANSRIKTKEIKLKHSLGIKAYNNKMGIIKKTIIPSNNKINGRWSKEMKEKFSLIKIEYYKNNPNQHPNRKCAGIKESYPEKMLREYFEQNRLIKEKDFFQQYKIDKYYVDFYIPKLSLVIEVDGERWHNNNEREKIRENLIKNKYNLIRFKANLLTKKQYEKDINNIINAIVA
jgi:very-short-patch-repair endonuclease